MPANNSTVPRSASNPAKPERPPGSPLFFHATGRWAKKIRGRLVYFGRGTHDAALAAYQEQRDDLHAGRMPRDQEGLTVYLLCGKFLTAKKHAMEAGELSPLTYHGYTELCKRLIKAFGRNRLVSDLRPEDFARLRAKMQKTWGPVRMKAEIVRARVPFNWAANNKLIDLPIAFGDGFAPPTMKTIRKHRQAKGSRMFEADEIRRMLEAATLPLRAMLLLGVQAGFGNSDCGNLPLTALDLDGGWINYARQKTGIARRVPLWPETLAAIREWLPRRPAPKRPELAGLVFLTVKGGSWANNTSSDNPVSKEMAKLVKVLGIEGRSFYGLRHTFQTIGDESGDFLAVRRIMGHASKDIADEYRERISDERLQRVVEFVRRWVYGET